MSTDATGFSSDTADLVSRGMEGASDSISRAGARHIRSTDDRLTLLAVRMVIIALSFFFACFFFALFYLQLVNENGMWLPHGITHPPLQLGMAETGLLLLAGLVYFAAQWGGLYQGNHARLQTGLWVALLLTVASCILHIAELHNPGFSIQGGGYVSVFIALEGTFTVFLILTAAVLFGMANRARLGLLRQSPIAVEAFGEYFGWVSAVALASFLALYVQPFFSTTG